MPLHLFRCSSCGTEQEELFRVSESPPSSMGCSCGGQAERERVSRFAVVGPVWSNLAPYEGALLTHAQRAAGQRITGPRELARLEARLGVVGMDPSSSAAQTVQADAADFMRDFDRVAQRDGIDAALTFQAVEETVRDGSSMDRSEIKTIIQDQDEGLAMMEDGTLVPPESSDAAWSPPAPSVPAEFAAAVVAECGVG